MFVDSEDATIGSATFDFEQRIRTYPNKAAGGSNFAEFDQQIRIMPVLISPELKGVTLRRNTQSTCATCVTPVTRWADDFNNAAGDSAYGDANDWNAYTDGRWGTRATTWNGTGKETIDLGWSLTATVDASTTATAAADVGTSGIPQVGEIAPRGDDYPTPSLPGCVLPYFKPTYTVDTDKYPAAGAYYWYMQQVMPDHAGSKRWNSLLHHLGPDTALTNDAGNKWTQANGRNVICGTSSPWTIHPLDASVGSVDCDEYAMAPTHESGGYPQSVNLATSGTKCAQLLTDKMGDGSANFGLLADTRTATNGPSGTERCGRAAISSTQNEEACSRHPAPAWRMLDGDGFFLNVPGYEHCTSTATTCTWREIG